MEGPKWAFHAFSQLLFLLMILGWTTGLQDLDIVRLNSSSWSIRSFFDFGAPVIDTNTVYLLNKSRFDPTLSSLAILRPDGNFYLRVQTLSDITFHLYGEPYGKTPNYRINISNFSIEKCDKANTCELLDKCVKIFVPNDKGGKDIVYFSWNFTTTEEIHILVQCKNQLLKCSDTEKVLYVHKFVMQSLQPQDIKSSEEESFIYSTNGDQEAVLNENFTLFNRSLYLQISQCLHCEAQLRLECSNFFKNVSVLFNETEKNCLQNDKIAYLWKKVSLQIPISNSSNNDICKLTITTIPPSDESQMQAFWALSPKAFKLYDNNDLDTNDRNARKNDNDMDTNDCNATKDDNAMDTSDRNAKKDDNNVDNLAFIERSYQMLILFCFIITVAAKIIS